MNVENFEIPIYGGGCILISKKEKGFNYQVFDKEGKDITYPEWSIRKQCNCGRKKLGYLGGNLSSCLTCLKTVEVSPANPSHQYLAKNVAVKKIVNHLKKQIVKYLANNNYFKDDIQRNKMVFNLLKKALNEKGYDWIFDSFYEKDGDSYNLNTKNINQILKIK